MSTVNSCPKPGASTPSPAPSSASGCQLHPALDKEYALGKKLGRGCFATVYKAVRRSDSVPVAVKVIDKVRLDAETASLLQNELEVLRAVSEHPGIVTLLDNVETETHMYFIMEYVDGGPLLDRIVSVGSFSENNARTLLRTTLLTLDFLADLGCVHRDIKPENILVDNHSKSWPVKLTDFGLSAKMQPDELLYGTLGTPLFVAPEILKGQGYDSSCDMWSLGVVLYLVLCGYPPFPYDTADNLIAAIFNGNYSFPAPEWNHVSGDAKDAVRRMMEVDPKRRLTPKEALGHPWFKAAQSTSDLPNSQLSTFNARRKLKASAVAVRTTVGLLSILKPSRRIGQQTQTPQELLEDVEKSRALIKALSIKEKGNSGSDETRAQPEVEQPKLRQSRRSLLLPLSIFESAFDEAPSYPNGEKPSPYGNPALHSTDSIPWNSQVMQSRAKAMVAEVKGSPVLDEDANPFFLPPSGPPQNVGPPRRPPKLQQLDFNDL